MFHAHYSGYPIVNMLEAARCVIDGVIERADRARQGGDVDTGRLLHASSMLEVCIIGIREVETDVKMLVAFARIQAALELIDGGTSPKRAGSTGARCSILLGLEQLACLARTACIALMPGAHRTDPSVATDGPD